MKKFIFLTVIFLFFFSALTSEVQANPDNKAGINLGGIWGRQNFTDAADIVGDGGWITLLSDACSYDRLNDLIFSQNRNVNVIIRLYNGGQVFKPGQAKAYVRMLGELETNGRAIYVVPWNEPNMDREAGGLHGDAAAKAVADFIKELNTQLNNAGLLNKKVYLLSPAFNQTAPTGASTTSIDDFVSEINSHINLNDYVSGYAMNVYQVDIYDDRKDDPHYGYKGVESLESLVFNSSKPIYITEFGKVVNGNPNYNDDTIASLLNEALPFYNNHSGRVRGVSPLAYDPEPTPNNFYLCSSSGCGSSNSREAIEQNHQSGDTTADTSSAATYTAWSTANCSHGECDIVANGVYCGLERVRDCENPFIGPKKEPCSPTTTVLEKDTPDEKDLVHGSIFDKIRFLWFGDTDKITITDQKIPIKGDLQFLLGFFNGPTPANVGEAYETFQTGVLPKLTSPGEALETLIGSIPSYLDDVAETTIDVSADTTENKNVPGSTVKLGAPEVWGLYNTAANLALMFEPPGTPTQQYLSAKLEENAILAKKRTLKPTTACANPANPYGPDSTEEPVTTTETPNYEDDSTEKVISINNSSSGKIVLAATDDASCPVRIDPPDIKMCIPKAGALSTLEKQTDEAECEVKEDEETRRCPAEGGTICGKNCPPGGSVTCKTYTQGDCDFNSSSATINTTPKVSFLNDPDDSDDVTDGYTDLAIKAYSIFKMPGTDVIPVDGEGELSWEYGSSKMTPTDKTAAYPMLGTVECMENLTKRSLTNPGDPNMPPVIDRCLVYPN